MLRPRADDDQPLNQNALGIRTTSGRWMLPKIFPSAMASGPAGYDWWTSTPEPCWEPESFPPSRWNTVPVIQVQAELRNVLETWGLPERIRVDNGTPWGLTGDFPTELSLWLIGLGVDVVWNPPGQPQHNGSVERSQGVGKKWAEPHTCSSVQELQRRIDKFDQIQRAVYPAFGTQTRLEAFPELSKPSRRYQPLRERKVWNWTRVLERLSEYSSARKVDCSGEIYIYGRRRFVGKKYSGTTVMVTLDPDSQEWEISTVQGRVIRHQPAFELDMERILRMDVTLKTPPTDTTIKQARRRGA